MFDIILVDLKIPTSQNPWKTLFQSCFKKITLKGRGSRCGLDEKMMRMWFGLEIDVVGFPPLLLMNKQIYNSYIFFLTLLKQRRNLLIREYLMFQDGRIPLHFAAATSPQLYSHLKTKTTDPALMDNFKHNPEVSYNHIWNNNNKLFVNLSFCGIPVIYHLNKILVIELCEFCSSRGRQEYQILKGSLKCCLLPGKKNSHKNVF